MSARIIHSIEETRNTCASAAAKGLRVGLVPTMGALHDGHLSLIRRAAEECDFVVVSVFVNPIQFNDKSDFAKYPKDLDRDAAAASEAGADVIFAPNAEEMYPDGFSTFVDMTGISGRLCGATREGHFRGVCTVVTKLFNIIAPKRAYFGEKDAQQLEIVKKMVRELSSPIEIIGCPIVREADGLAMSSRNTRLSAEEREAALCLNRALREAKALFDSGETSHSRLIAAIRTLIEKEPLSRIEYIEIVGTSDFEPSDPVRSGDLAALAVFFGEVRLIDNIKF